MNVLARKSFGICLVDSLFDLAVMKRFKNKDYHCVNEIHVYVFSFVGVKRFSHLTSKRLY